MKNMMIIAITVLFVAGLAVADDWPCWRGPDRNGVSSETALKADGISNKLWKARTDTGYSSVTIAKGRVFALGNNGGADVLYCLDAKTGEMKWKASYDCPKGGGYAGPRATPVVSGESVFTFSREGRLTCFNAKTGREIWTVNVTKFGARNISWQFSGSPLVMNGAVIVNAGESGMAFDAETGRKLWASSGKGGYATPVPFQYRRRSFVAIFSFNSLKIVRPKDGKVVASTAWPTKYDVNAADPVVTRNGAGIFITSGYGNAGALFKFNGRSLKQVWKNKNLKGHFSSPILFDGKIYGADGNTGRGALVCLSLKTGRELWREKSVGYGSLIIADGKIFYLGDRGILTVCNASPKGFAKLASAKLFHGRQNWVAPALADGRLYCRSPRGELLCFNLK